MCPYFKKAYLMSVKSKFRGSRALITCTFVLGCAQLSCAADQTVVGAGNARAMQLAKSSPLVMSSLQLLKSNLVEIPSVPVRTQLAELMDHDKACIKSRANLTAEDKAKLLVELDRAGLIDHSEATRVQGGVMAGIFPPIADDGSSCPKMPQAFYSAPGGATGGHHSEPGGLPVHEAFNDLSSIAFASNYKKVYGSLGKDGLPRAVLKGQKPSAQKDAFIIDSTVVFGAPVWHDWAKTIVFQWNADGTEFVELNFGGNGKTDNNGAAGDSKTGAHHILGIAEALKRDMPADFVISVASAHSYPTYGNEYKVVNWIRAAAILAQVDPFAKGVLQKDNQGKPRLAAVRKLGDIDLTSADDPVENTLIEYVLHNLSDADYVFTGPAAKTVKNVLAKLAPEYGYNDKDPEYLFKFRHPALAYLSAERLHVVYSNGGLSAVRAEINKLRKLKLI
jgi:hypothetical protein